MPDKVFDQEKLCSPKPKGRPNMLVITYDGWRWDFDGTHANIDMRGSAIKRIWDKGVMFDKAYVPSPVCAPSRSALAMARDYDVSPVRRNPQEVPHDVDTYFERLQDAGYFTMMSGKDHIRMITGIGLDGMKSMKELGWSAAIGTVDTWEFADEPEPHDPYGLWLLSQGRDVWDEMVTEYGTYPFGTKPSSYCPDDSVGLTYYCPQASAYAEKYRLDLYNLQLAKDVFTTYYLGDAEAMKKPWMWLVNFMGGHPPLIMSPPALAAVENREITPPIQAPSLDADKIKFVRKAYTALLEDCDNLTNALLDWVDEKSPGGLDNVIVFLTADHGEMAGDWDLTRKQTVHEGSTRVPLAVMGPGVTPRGRLIKTPVSTLDVAGTLMDVAGARPAGGMTAQSLMPVMNGAGPVRTIIESGLTMGTNDLRVRWKQYNNSMTLKYFCCNGGCKFSTLYPQSTTAQMGLLTVDDAGDGDDVLAAGRTEALELFATLTPDYQEVCQGLF